MLKNLLKVEQLVKIRPVYLRKHKKYKNAQNLSPSENFSGSFQPSSVCTHFLKQLGLPYSILIHFSACCEMLSLSVKMALSDPKYRDDMAVSWPCAQPFSQHISIYYRNNDAATNVFTYKYLRAALLVFQEGLEGSKSMPGKASDTSPQCPNPPFPLLGIGGPFPLYPQQ